MEGSAELSTGEGGVAEIDITLAMGEVFGMSLQTSGVLDKPKKESLHAQRK